MEVLVAALEDEGYRVLTAANGRRGLERLEENKPDLVISDFMTPLMDGAAMVAAMRASPSFRDIPVVMMSAAPQSAQRKYLDGYEAFPRKPFRIPALLDIVRSVLERAPGDVPT